MEAALYTAEQLRHDFAIDLIPLLFGWLMLAVGAATIVLSSLRWRARERGLIWFGVFWTLYGARMLFVENGTIPFLLAVEESKVYFVRGLANYVVPLAAWLLVREVLGDGWRSSLKWLVRIQAVFAPLAILSDLIRREPESGNMIQKGIVIAAMVLIVASIPRKRLTTLPGWRALLLATGFLVFSVLVRNLFSEVVGGQLEPISFFALGCCFGYVIFERIYSREKQLVSIESELATAREIQRGILPARNPETDGLKFAVRYEPMTAVAGDFYDFQRLDSHRVGVLVADVSGHGVPAALIASMVKVAFGVQVSLATQPAKVLAGLNDALHGRLDRQFVTAGYLYVDQEQGKMWYAGAAHPPLLVWRHSSGISEEIIENGLMLGPFADSVYSQASTSIGPGDRVLMVTDGVLEATDPDGGQFGMERLKLFLEQNPELSSDSFADALLRHLAEWSGTTNGKGQEDDITLLVVDAVGNAETRDISEG
jgi:phosphoserine phosphatase RsbU/P